MRESEARWFEQSGTPSIDVMERAAQALRDAAKSMLPDGGRVYVACGTGGNGGDGTACARLLKGCCEVVVVQPAPAATDDAVTNFRRAQAAGVPVIADPDALEDAPPDLWIDALFGTGLARSPSGDFSRLIARINRDRALGAKVLCADIPSGLNGRTGRAYEVCVSADQTVTFGFLKTGLVLADGLDRAGSVHVADVGFPADAFGPMDARLLEPTDIPALMPKRPRNVYKNACGHLLIVAGSYGMAGAAVMCASAALRSGAGLVTVACPRSIVPILQTRVPQAMCVPLAEEDGRICAEALAALRAALPGKDAVAIGPGLSRDVPPAIVRAALEAGLPAVVDADALNILSAHPELLALLRPVHVITPHPGEAARLFAAAGLDAVDRSDPVAAAEALRRLGGTALYKGASCVISGAEGNYVSRSGCEGMARGGSGDILTGIIGALLADPQGRTPAQSAALASEIHGLAGEAAQRRYGSRAMNALDLIGSLPEVLR